MSPARLLALIAGCVGIALIVDAAVTATSDFHVVVRGRTYACGSGISEKDPRNLTSKHASIPPVLSTAGARCDATRTTRNHRAEILLVPGAIAILVALMASGLGSRGHRRRRRRRYATE